MRDWDPDLVNLKTIFFYKLNIYIKGIICVLMGY